MIHICTDAALMHRIANSDGVRESVGIEVVLDGGCDITFAVDEAALWLEIDLSRVQLAPSEPDS